MVNDNYVDRDLGTRSSEARMIEFLNFVTDPNNPMPSTAGFASRVDTTQWVKNLAFYAVMHERALHVARCMLHSTHTHAPV